ncbi:MAG: hypothetical protein D6820_16910, partial [Lentisphaerae bacterium]
RLHRLPRDHSQYRALSELCTQVRNRLSRAGIVPLSILLGPLILSFLWCASRLDPANRNPAPGSSFIVTAEVDPDFAGAVRLVIPPQLQLDAQYPSVQKITLYRPVLQRFLNAWHQRQHEISTRSFFEQIQLSAVWQRYMDELEHFIKHGQLPPQYLHWRIISPLRSCLWMIQVRTDNDTGGLKLTLPVGDTVPPCERELISLPGPRGKSRQISAWMSKADNPRSPVRAIWAAVQQKPVARQPFWGPLAWLEPPPGTPPRWYHAIFAPWIVLYLLVYLPLFFITRAILRIP